jgi:hypothetical protein
MNFLQDWRKFCFRISSWPITVIHHLIAAMKFSHSFAQNDVTERMVELAFNNSRLKNVRRNDNFMISNGIQLKCCERVGYLSQNEIPNVTSKIYFQFWEIDLWCHESVTSFVIYCFWKLIESIVVSAWVIPLIDNISYILVYSCCVIDLHFGIRICELKSPTISEKFRRKLGENSTDRETLPCFHWLFNHSPRMLILRSRPHRVVLNVCLLTDARS